MQSRSLPLSRFRAVSQAKRRTIKEQQIGKLCYYANPEANMRLSDAYDSGFKQGSWSALKAVFWLLLGFVIALLVGRTANAQQQLGAIATPQINSTLFVGQVGYPTIQSTLSKACNDNKYSTWRIQIPAGATPSDNIGAVSGCSKAYIQDLRTAAITLYSWSGSAYVAVTAGSNNFLPPLTVSGNNVGLAGTITQPEVIQSLNNAINADSFPGTDMGAKIMLADAMLGSQPGIITVTTGGTGTTPITLGPNHTVLQNRTADHGAHHLERGLRLDMRKLRSAHGLRKSQLCVSGEQHLKRSPFRDAPCMDPQAMPFGSPVTPTPSTCWAITWTRWACLPRRRLTRSRTWMRSEIRSPFRTRPEATAWASICSM